MCSSCSPDGVFRLVHATCAVFCIYVVVQSCISVSGSDLCEVPMAHAVVWKPGACGTMLIYSPMSITSLVREPSGGRKNSCSNSFLGCCSIDRTKFMSPSGAYLPCLLCANHLERGLRQCHGEGHCKRCLAGATTVLPRHPVHSGMECWHNSPTNGMLAQLSNALTRQRKHRRSRNGRWMFLNRMRSRAEIVCLRV